MSPSAHGSTNGRKLKLAAMGVLVSGLIAVSLRDGGGPPRAGVVEIPENHPRAKVVSQPERMKAPTIQTHCPATSNLPDVESSSAQTAQTTALRQWVEANPRLAAAWADKLPDGAAREQMLGEVALAWANRDLTAAAAWANQLRCDTEKNRALAAIASEGVRSQPVAALHLAVQLPENAARDEVIRRAAMEWATQDAESAASWARQIPDETLRQQTLAAIATVWSDTDPRLAATLAARELSSGRHQSDAVVGIAQRWAQQEPEQAAAWVDLFPSGETQNAALQNVATIWAQIDATGAQEWRDAHSP